MWDVGVLVSDALASCGASAEYDNSKAKAVCHSRDGVEFRVRLYRGKGKFSHGVIVEVQWREGFCPRFHLDALSILDVVEVKKSVEETCFPLDTPKYAIGTVG